MSIVRVVNKPYISIAKNIFDMAYGETGYTVPWAYDPRGNTLDTSYPVMEKPKGTCDMMVRKTDQGDFEVYPPNNYFYKV